jgi:hypothetical protein
MPAMLSGNQSIPVEVETEAGELISELRSAGWKVSISHYEAKSFGNWYLDVTHAVRTIHLVKDRSQYMITRQSPPELNAAGLWRAFDNLQEFRHLLIRWIKTQIPSG